MFKSPDDFSIWKFDREISLELIYLPFLISCVTGKEI